MKVFKLSALLLLFACFAVLTACSKEEIYPTSEAPLPAAAVVNCDLQGPCQLITDWTPDINQVLNECYTETPESGCVVSSHTTQVDIIVGTAEHGGVLHGNCCINDVDIDLKVAYYADLAKQNRPDNNFVRDQGIQGVIFNDCKWVITGFKFKYLGPAPSGISWLFKLTVTYTQVCCPLKTIPSEKHFQFSPGKLFNSGSNKNDWAVLLEAKGEAPANGVNVFFYDAADKQIEVGQALPGADPHKFIYFPTAATWAVPGAIRAEAR